MLGISPLRNTAYVFAIKLLKPGSLTYRIDPTLDLTKDFKISFWDYSTDYAAFTENSGTETILDTIKKFASGGSSVLISLTASQMDHDVVIITAADADGLLNNWTNNCWIIYPDTRQTELAHLDANVSSAKADLTPVLADTSAIKTVTDALPDAGALSTIQSDITAIEAVTDALPDAGALSTIQTDVSAIEVVTDALPDAGALTTMDSKLDTIIGYIDTEITSIQDSVNNVLADLTDTDDGLLALKTLLDVVNVKCTSIKNLTTAQL